MKKITDEMIMDLADGNLNNKQAKDVILFIKKNSTARKKYEAFVKTSADFGKLNSQNDSAQEIPSEIRNLINQSKAYPEQKANQKKMFLDFTFFSNFFANFRGIRTGFGIAAASLMIGIFGTNIYFNNTLLDRNKLTTRSGGINQFENKLQTILFVNNQELSIGEAINNKDEITLSVIPFKDGKVSLSFIGYEELNPIEKKVSANKINKIQKFRVTYPPNILSFRLEYFIEKDKYSKTFEFIVKE